MDNTAFDKITYGVYIVSAGKGPEINAFVATSVFQVTDNPCRIAVACNKKNYTGLLIDKYENFAVSVMRRRYDAATMGNFGFRSGKGYNKFANIKPITGSRTGTPIVTEDAIAWFECRLVSRLDVGSHILYVGEVMDMAVLSDEEPLTYRYYRDIKKGVVPENAPHSAKGTPEKPTISIHNNLNQNKMKKYKCVVCGYIYDPAAGDPDSGIASGTAFDELPDDWTCPLCGVGKEDFEPVE